MFKKLLLIFLPVFIACAFNIGSYAGEVRTVAIIEFNNNFNSYRSSGWRAARKIQDRLIAGLTNSDEFRVVEKQLISDIIKEQKFSISGLVDESETAIELGSLIGAEHIIAGNLNSISLEESKFTGYGTTIYEVKAKMEAGIRMINVTTGIIEMAKTYEAEKVLDGVSKNSVDIDAVNDQLVDIIADDFYRDLDQYKFTHYGDNQDIYVSFTSTPGGASVELNGLYIGNTPLEVPIEPGVHRVKIYMGGYHPWEMSVNLDEDMNQIEANLGLLDN